jgi:hypothetical protein
MWRLAPSLSWRKHRAPITSLLSQTVWDLRHGHGIVAGERKRDAEGRKLEKSARPVGCRLAPEGSSDGEVSAVQRSSADFDRKYSLRT